MFPARASDPYTATWHELLLPDLGRQYPRHQFQLRTAISPLRSCPSITALTSSSYACRHLPNHRDQHVVAFTSSSCASPTPPRLLLRHVVASTPHQFQLRTLATHPSSRTPFRSTTAVTSSSCALRPLFDGVENHYTEPRSVTSSSYARLPLSGQPLLSGYCERPSRRPSADGEPPRHRDPPRGDIDRVGEKHHHVSALVDLDGSFEPGWRPADR